MPQENGEEQPKKSYSLNTNSHKEAMRKIRAGLPTPGEVKAARRIAKEALREMKKDRFKSNQALDSSPNLSFNQAGISLQDIDSLVFPNAVSHADRILSIDTEKEADLEIKKEQNTENLNSEIRKRTAPYFYTLLDIAKRNDYRRNRGFPFKSRRSGKYVTDWKERDSIPDRIDMDSQLYFDKQGLTSPDLTWFDVNFRVISEKAPIAHLEAEIGKYDIHSVKLSWDTEARNMLISRALHQAQKFNDADCIVNDPKTGEETTVLGLLLKYHYTDSIYHMESASLTFNLRENPSVITEFKGTTGWQSSSSTLEFKSEDADFKREFTPEQYKAHEKLSSTGMRLSNSIVMAALKSALRLAPVDPKHIPSE